jgi:hypothetical protein
MQKINPNPENGSLADIEEGIRCSPCDILDYGLQF